MYRISYFLVEVVTINTDSIIFIRKRFNRNVELATDIIDILFELIAFLCADILLHVSNHVRVLCQHWYE